MELKERIAQVLTDDCVNEEGNCPQSTNTQCKYCIADKILALVKEAGWKSPEEVAFFTADVAKAEGYVKLSSDQDLPENYITIFRDASLDSFLQRGYKIAQEDMLKSGWMKVEKNDK